MLEFRRLDLQREHGDKLNIFIIIALVYCVSSASIRNNLHCGVYVHFKSVSVDNVKGNRLDNLNTLARHSLI